MRRRCSAWWTRWGGAVASYAVADVTQPAEVQGYVQTALERYQGMDILLANAGIEGVVQPITDYPIDVFDQVMAECAWCLAGTQVCHPSAARSWRRQHHFTSSTAGIRVPWASQRIPRVNTPSLD